MEMIKNKIAESGIITLDLGKLIPNASEILFFDIKDYLFRELILREKDFREALKILDTTSYQDKYLAVYCSADAIIPMWAYMLIATKFEGVVKGLYFETPETIQDQILITQISNLNNEDFLDQRVVVKGCGDASIPAAAFLEISKKLTPLVKSLMYGEPCSTVPIYKKRA